MHLHDAVLAPLIGILVFSPVVARAEQAQVDSLGAARHATVLDTRSLQRGSERSVVPASARVEDPTPPPNAPRPHRASAASRATRHPAFRDAGSPLDSLWPVKGPTPLPGSILPAKRIVAFYGNPLSKRMGILGEYRRRRHAAQARRGGRGVEPHRSVDTGAARAAPHRRSSPTRTPGRDGKYRTRHDSAMIEKVYGWAKSRNALLFLDLQVGQSTLQEELPWIEKFLMRPDVHLGIDPEFSMKSGGDPRAARRHLRRRRRQLRVALPRRISSTSTSCRRRSSSCTASRPAA